MNIRLLGARVAALALCLVVLPALAESEWKAYSTPGGQAPLPLVLTTMDGKTVDLAALRGQVVLLNFWATWCEPCKQEMPSLDQMSKKLGQRGLKVVGVNFGENRARIEQFLKAWPVSFPILRDDDSAVAKAWRVRMLPASFLVDKKGMLRYQMVGDANWEDAKVQGPILELLK